MKWVGFTDGKTIDDDQRAAAESVAAEKPSQDEAVAEETAEVEEVVEQVEEEELPEAEDDIFNTEYVDVVTSGDFKFVYVPDSPTESGAAEDDPFDTSVVEKVVGPLPVIKKKKQLVSIGAAVEILTRKTEASSSSSRRRPRPTDIQLLGCFDDEPVNNGQSAVVGPAFQHPDDQLKVDLLSGDVDIQLSSDRLSPHPDNWNPEDQRELKSATPDLKDILAEFDVIVENAEKAIEEEAQLQPADEDDIEFEALAIESLAKKQPEPQPATDEEDFEFEALALESLAKAPPNLQPDHLEPEGDDPFDTRSVEQILEKRLPIQVVKKAPTRPAPPRRPSPAPVVVQDPIPAPVPDVVCVTPVELNPENDPFCTDNIVLPSPTCGLDFDSTGDDPFDTSLVDKVVTRVAEVAEIKLEQQLGTSFGLLDTEDICPEDDPFDTSAVEKILN